MLKQVKEARREREKKADAELLAKRNEMRKRNSNDNMLRGSGEKMFRGESESTSVDNDDRRDGNDGDDDSSDSDDDGDDNSAGGDGDASCFAPLTSIHTSNMAQVSVL